MNDTTQWFSGKLANFNLFAHLYTINSNMEEIVGLLPLSVNVNVFPLASFVFDLATLGWHGHFP